MKNWEKKLLHMAEQNDGPEKKILQKFLICLIGIFLFLCAEIGSCDVLTLNNGDELFGDAISANQGLVQFKTPEGVRKLTATEVLKLEFESFRKIDGEDSPEKIKDPVVRDSLANFPDEDHYQQAARVDVLDEERYDLNNDGTFSSEFRELFAVLKEKAREDANFSFSYFPDIEDFQIVYGRSVSPGAGGLASFLGTGQKGSVRYLSDRTIADESDFAEIPFYQRRHTVKFAIPEVNAGTLVDVKFRVIRKKNDPLKPFFVEKHFQDFEPSKISRLIVSVPKGKKVLYKLEEKSVKVKTQIQEENGRTIYSFEAADVPALLEEPQMPSLARMVSRVTFSVENDWTKVAETIRNLVVPLEEKALKDPVLSDFVEKTCQGKMKLSEKARALYICLARDISVVGVSPEDFSYQPSDPVEIIKRRQASLYDLGFLYHVCLRKLGVENELLLLREKETGNLVSEVPTFAQLGIIGVKIASESGPFAFNLPVCSEVGPEYLHPAIQGAVGISIQTGLPVEIPMIQCDNESRQVVSKVRILENGSIRVSRVTKYSGNFEIDMRSYKNFREKEIRVSLENIIHDEFHGAKLLDFKFENLQDVTKPLSLSIEFEVPDFALKSGGDFLVLPLPVDQSEYSATLVGPNVRQSDFYWPIKTQRSQEMEILIPEGYSIYAFPTGDWAAFGSLFYHSSFGFEINKVIFRDVYQRDTDLIPSENYKFFKKLIEEKSKTSERWIVFKKTSNK
ncbi:MAG: DUF3857 domain-containing protein [Candidatus Riflebacteria bacterium]|nr:DUF3857 domain-containing protein [Candidatus Riflebacteria bacterium]